MSYTVTSDQKLEISAEKTDKNSRGGKSRSVFLSNKIYYFSPPGHTKGKENSEQ